MTRIFKQILFFFFLINFFNTAYCSEYFKKGVELFNNKKYEDAKFMFERSIVFDPKNSMVVASLIKRAVDGQNPLVVWGDGSAIRDFIHCRDVAQGMMDAIENEVYSPINLGSGTGTSIKQLVEIIVNNLDTKPEVIFDTTKPSGDKLRILDTTRAKSNNIIPKISLENGVIETIQWYKENKDKTSERTYNAFKENN